MAGFVKANLDNYRCDYCGRQGSDQPIAADIDLLLDRIAEGLFVEYGDPNEELPYESAEGGFQGDVLGTDEVLIEENCGFHEALRQDVIRAFGGRQWCKRNYFSLSKDEALMASWRAFSEEILHHRRYTALRASAHDAVDYEGDLIRPTEVLDRIGEVISATQRVVKCPAGTRFFRARVHDVGEIPSGAEELGSPPRDIASSNRMSAAGISMFYGAREKATAIAEVRSVPQNIGLPLVTVGAFKTDKPVLLVDLTNLPTVPSLFDEGNRVQRPLIRFLRDFVKDLSKPISRDGREHVDYVPTQVVTEYFQHLFATENGEHVRGILYPSVHAPRGQCCVLFFGPDACCDDAPGWSADPRKWLALETATTELMHEGYARFLASDEFSELRRDGLRLFGRTKPFTAEEWWESGPTRAADDAYLAFGVRCQDAGLRYGLAGWIVKLACLMADYHRELDPFPITASRPPFKIVIKTDCDPLFLEWLRHEAWDLGLRVVDRTGGIEIVPISIPFPARPTRALTDQQRPPVEAAFSFEIEPPSSYSPAAAGELAHGGQQLRFELMRRLGYSVSDSLPLAKSVG